MGNRLSRRRYAPAETAATEHKPSVEPACSTPGEDSPTAQTQEIDQPESRGPPEEPEMSDACSTQEKECVSKCEEESPAAPAPEVHDVLMEPTEPNPVAEVHPAPEPEPDTSFLEADPEGTSEPSSDPEPTSTEALEETTQELLPESASPSTLIIPDVTLTPVLTLIGPSEASAGEGGDGEANAVEDFTAEPDAATEMSEFLENTQVEAAESMQTLGSDVIESVDEILKNSELKGNDLLSDLIPGDVNLYDDTPIMSGQLI
ncbi:lysine-rich arabinogalactan protein 18 [Oryzias melastigma]|uniref:lysine-rich arabinogalactan protein 18 n=1 Tax=Oryzias melastigma TaxID=30732 RepID=UPI000CF7FC29|nr:lysine-rich arabinogalactan protein 18 [Oryzias melastigma]